MPSNPADIPQVLLAAPSVAKSLAGVTVAIYVLGQLIPSIESVLAIKVCLCLCLCRCLCLFVFVYVSILNPKHAGEQPVWRTLVRKECLNRELFEEKNSDVV